MKLELPVTTADRTEFVPAWSLTSWDEFCGIAEPVRQLVQPAIYRQKSRRITRGKLKPGVVKSLRAGQFMSQRVLAAASKIPLGTLQRAEQGRAVNPKTIRKLTEFFGVTPGELVETEPRTGDAKE